MPGALLKVDIEGLQKADMALLRLVDKLQKPGTPAKAASVYLYGETMRNFRAGGRPEAWAPLSLLTLFIRAHRADAPNKNAKILQDKGRLIGSINPFSAADGSFFGVGTNVDYAGMMQNGGTGKGMEVSIAPFSRRKPGQGSTKSGYASLYGVNVKSKPSRGSMVSVRGYTMKLKGGEVPARPFLPRPQDMSSMGMWDKIKEIFRSYFYGR